MQNIKNFLDLVQQDRVFYITPKGHLWVLSRILGRIPWLRDQLYLQTAHNFITYLGSLESIPVSFGAVQAINFHAIIEATEALLSYLDKSTSLDVKSARLNLQRSLIGLLYRLERENGGIDPGRSDLMLLGAFYQAADDWKAGQRIFWESNLTHQEVRRLQEAARYHEFVKLLLIDPALAESFFRWVIRDGIDPIPFIEFPYNQRVIAEAELHGRIGRLGGRLLRVKKMNGEKQLTLLIQGKEESILQLDRIIEFKGGYFLTINDVYDIFKKKKIHPGNLECFPDGIINWNAHCLGWWNNFTKAYEVVDVTVDEWWKQLPTFESLTIEQAKARYGDHMDGKQWNLSAKASREFFNLNFEKTHAYLEIAIPDGKGSYSIYDFGKFATQFPANMWEIVTTISVSVQATIAFPDENVYYTHRQHIGYSFPITPEQGKLFMDEIREDILLARSGNIVFQIESENCGRWIQSRLEDQLGKQNVPNLFKLHMVETEPDGIWKWGWELTRILPKRWQTRFMAVCQYPLGAWKGCWVLNKEKQPEWKSLTHSPYWDDGMVYLPSLMHKTDEMGALSKDAGRHYHYFSSIKELTHKGIKMDRDPFASLDLFDKERAA